MATGTGVEGINPYVYEVVNGKVLRRSIEQARRIAEPGRAIRTGATPQTGKPLVLYYDAVATGPDDKAHMNWWRKQFSKLGIQLVVRNTDYNRFQEKVRKGTAQMFSWGWNADYPDPENFLFLLYGPNAKVDGGGENASNYANPEFDALFARMKNMDNGPERLAIIDRMLEILRRDAPWLWGYHPKAFSLHHAWYHNVKPNLMANNTLKYKRIDPQLRAQRRQAWNQPVLWPVASLGTVLLISLIPAFIMFRRRERSSGDMIAYIIRRMLYAIPILLGVNIITFMLFFVVNSPDDMARMNLGMKRVTPEAIQQWKEERGYDLPLLYNAAARGWGKTDPDHLLSEIPEAVPVRFRLLRQWS